MRIVALIISEPRERRELKEKFPPSLGEAAALAEEWPLAREGHMLFSATRARPQALRVRHPPVTKGQWAPHLALCQKQAGKKV